MQKLIMNWKKFRQLKGQSVQDYTQEFRKRALMLGVDLHSRETLLKYIGGLHSYLRHTILMFNPTSLDEVCFKPPTLRQEGKIFQKRVKRSHLRVERKERVANEK